MVGFAAKASFRADAPPVGADVYGSLEAQLERDAGIELRALQATRAATVEERLQVFALFLLLSYNGVMLFGSGKLIEALTRQAISWQMAVALMAAVSFFYAIAGGLIAAVWNDFFQGILTIVMSVLLIPFFWVEIGGSTGIQAKLAESQHPNIAHLFDLVLN